MPFLKLRPFTLNCSTKAEIRAVDRQSDVFFFYRYDYNPENYMFLYFMIYKYSNVTNCNT